MATTMLRFPAVLNQVGRSRSALYLDTQAGLFPPPVSIGPRSVGFPDYEVEAVIAARIAGKSDSEIRALVSNLVAARRRSIG